MPAGGDTPTLTKEVRQVGTNYESLLAAYESERAQAARADNKELVALIDEQIAWLTEEKPKKKRRTRKTPGVETAVNR